MGGSDSSRGVVSGGIGVLVQEQSESTVASSAQVLDKDILEILKGDRMVTVSIIGHHEFKSFISVSWVVNVQRTVKIRDHLSGFHGVHVSTSVSIILTENLSGENSSTVFVQSSFVNGGSGWEWSGDWGVRGVSSSLGLGNWSLAGVSSSLGNWSLGSVSSSLGGGNWSLLGGGVSSSSLSSGNWSLSGSVSSSSLAGSDGRHFFFFWILYLI